MTIGFGNILKVFRLSQQIILLLITFLQMLIDTVRVFSATLFFPFLIDALPAKAPAFLPLTDKLIGKGVVYAQGDEHKHQRRLIAPAFT